MTPVQFRGSNTVFAKDQPPYIPMPAHRSDVNGRVTTCWKLTPLERLKVLWRGVVWHQLATGGSPPQPQKITVERPELWEQG